MKSTRETQVLTSAASPWMERYGTTRFWAVDDGVTLVCVWVDKRGALEVLRRLAHRSCLLSNTYSHPTGSAAWLHRTTRQDQA